MKETIRFAVIRNITKTLRFDERQAVVDKLPENTPVRFLAEIALRGLADPKEAMSADELAVQTRILTGGIRTEIFNAKPR